MVKIAFTQQGPLANQLHLQERSTTARISALAKRGIFSKTDAKTLQKTYLSLYKMRIEEATYFNGENDDVALSEQAFRQSEEKATLLREELCRLKEEEVTLHASKRTGRESMADLLKNRQLQDAYHEEISHLNKFIRQHRILPSSTFSRHKVICSKAIEAIKKHKDSF